MRSSLLKFEPRVSNFPITESGKPVSVTTATGKVLARVYVIFLSFTNFYIRSKRRYKLKPCLSFLHAVSKRASKSYKSKK